MSKTIEQRETEQRDLLRAKQLLVLKNQSDEEVAGGNPATTTITDDDINDLLNGVDLTYEANAALYAEEVEPLL